MVIYMDSLSKIMTDCCPDGKNTTTTIQHSIIITFVKYQINVTFTLGADV